MRILCYQMLLLSLHLQVLLLFTTTSGNLLPSDMLSFSEVCRSQSIAEYEEHEQLLSARENFEEHEEYTSEWIVKIVDGEEAADEIARRHGFINNGPDDLEEGVYYFVLNAEESMLMPRSLPYQNKTQLLRKELSVSSAEQKTINILCSKSGIFELPVLPNESTDREKRQARVNNLRTTWLNSSIVIVSWDHPDTGPPELYYRFVHAAIIVSDGTSNVSHDSFTLDRLNTSITLSSVDRNHLHIFHVNAVYQSSVFSRIYLEGQATLPGPTITAIKALDSSSMSVSWNHIPTAGQITYAVVFYNGSHIGSFNGAGISTSQTIDGLKHLQTFIVFVVAMSGDSYGASVEFFTLEAVRLIGGTSNCAGRVEVYHNGQWGTVCDDNWDVTDANVVCSQVLCAPAVEAPGGAYYGEGTGTIWMDNVHCTAQDDALEDCRFNGWGNHNCKHSKDAGVRCGVSCPDLIHISNGGLLLNGSTPGEIATYICNDGYQLVGNATRTCQENGEWSGQPPECVQCTGNGCLNEGLCSAVSNPANGRVSVTGLTSGSTATYTCNTGYQLTGAQTRTCQSNGIWSGQAPTCTRVCDTLPTPTTGHVTWTGLTSGSTATYTCNMGYQLTGDQFRTCQSNGQWSGMEPTCTRLCPALPSPENGQVSWTGLTSDSTANYSCNTGYQLIGDQIRTCLDTGIWSGQQPNCTLLPPVVSIASPPRNVILSQESSNSLQVTWDHFCDGPPTTHYLITYICVQFGTAFSTDQPRLAITVPTTNTSAALVNLDLSAGSMYIVVVTSVSAETTASSEMAWIHMYKEVPQCLCRPVITGLSPDSAANLTITWTHPCGISPTTSYIFTTLALSSGVIFTYQPAVHTTLSTESTSITIGDIEQVAGNIYIFVVTAVSGDKSVSSLPKQFIIPNPSGTPPPTNVSVTKQTSTSAIISWTPPQGGSPFHYFIYCVPIETNEEKQLQAVTGTASSYTPTGLNEGNTYIVMVVARAATTSVSDPVIFTH